jgi:putative zinc finger protein
MPGKEDKGMSCSEFDALLSQAIDGTLAGERLAQFEAHGRECQLCGPLLQEAEAGRSWLKSLTEVEPPVELVTNVLLRTTGLAPLQGRAAGKTEPSSWGDRLREWGALMVSPVVGVARQPRFAMSFGMAFFTLSVTLSLAGVKISDLRNLNLRPSAIRRTYYETSGKVVKYYENIRFVYEIESRVRQFKEATAPQEQPHEQPNENRKDKSKNDTSGQPEQKQERNYSREGSQPVFASLHHAPRANELSASEPPGISVTTNRRFV